LAMHRGGQRQ